MAQQDRVIEFMPRQVLNRHWVWIALWYAGGLALGRVLRGGELWLCALFFVAGAVVLCGPFRMPRRAYRGLAFLCLALGCGVYGVRGPEQQSDVLSRFALSYPRRPVTLEGVVVGAQLLVGDGDYTTFVLQTDHRIEQGERIAAPGRVHVRWSRPVMPVHAGTRVRLSGRLSPHLGVVNHGVRGMEDFYRSRGIFSRVNTFGDAVEVVGVNRLSPRYWASRLRYWQHGRLERIVPESVYPFILGVWLGERSHINRDTYQRFIHAGTAHVLAVSGVHVAIIALSLRFLLQMLRMPRRSRLLLVMAGVVIFALMTGARTPTLRAALMMCLYFASELVDREPDSLSTLGLAGFLLLVWNPALLFDSGFLLSFGSVGSIMLFYPGLSHALRLLPVLIRVPLATTLSVQAATLPIAAWHFNTVPLLGILANILVVPLLTLVLWLCLVANLVGLVLPAAALLPGHTLLPVVALINLTNETVLKVPGAYAIVTRPGFAALICYAMALLFLFALFYDGRNRMRNACAVTALLLLSLAFWMPLNQPAVVDFIDVGRGDATFIRTPEGATLLVDGGDVSAYTDAGARVVAPFLYANGVTRLDYVVVSHAHRDHIGGLFSLLDRFRIGTVLLGPETPAPASLEQAFVAACRERAIPVQRVAAGEQIPVAGATVRVLHPCPDRGAGGLSENDRSLVLHVSWPGLSLLLTGDVEERAEASLLAQTDAAAAVLKVPHHGSPTSSTESFLKLVRPHLAVASMQAAGGGQSLMPPVMTARYAEMDIPLLRTDWHGGVRLLPARHKDGMQALSARGARGYCLSPQPGN